MLFGLFDTRVLKAEGGGKDPIVAQNFGSLWEEEL